MYVLSNSHSYITNSAIFSSVVWIGNPSRMEHVVKAGTLLLQSGGGVVVTGVVVTSGVVFVGGGVVTGFIPNIPLSPKHSTPGGALEVHDESATQARLYCRHHW